MDIHRPGSVTTESVFLLAGFVTVPGTAWTAPMRGTVVGTIYFLFGHVLSVLASLMTSTVLGDTSKSLDSLLLDRGEIHMFTCCQDDT